MSTATTALHGFSEELRELVARTVTGVVAVKSAAYRTVSGVSIRENLVAVTDATLRREERIPVHAADGSQGTGTLLGRDSRIQVAFLRVEGLSLKPLPAQDPVSLAPGMLAAVVGLTTDAGPSASLGILGAVGAARRTWRGGHLDHFIRLDVNVYPSQAGAAVVDCDARLIGIATPGLLQYSAVAIPAVTLNRMADELLAQGRIRQGYLGIGLQRVILPESWHEKIGSHQNSGLIILSVETNSAAETAGLQIGDILISFDGRPLPDVDDLQNVLRGENIGRPVTVGLIRGGETLQLPITVGERAGRSQ
ncbi:MAG: serine protease [Acidobacteriaceae bacterium]|nr:serine protease [Acidobacteriaceae bacterium]